MTKREEFNYRGRPRVSRRTLVGGAAAAAAALSSGQLSSAAPAGSSRTLSRYQDDSASIIIGTLGEAQSINPFLTNESEGDWRCKMLFDEFVRAHPATFTPEPGLAESWSNEDLTFTFNIRENATFSDGADVTADDVAFTIKGHLAAETGSSRQVKFLSIAGAEEYAAGTADDVSGITVGDPKTLQITLAQPDAPFLYNLRFIFVVPAALLEGRSLTDDEFFQNPVGAGPYMFQSWDVGADFVMTANPNYWQEGKPAITDVVHRTIADANSLVLALESGDIDASNYPAPTAKEQLEANEELVILVPPFNSPNGWMFNTENEWLSNPNVRRAIAMALDTEQFAADSLLGLGEAGNGPIAPGSWAYDTEMEPIPYDVDAARQLLAEADVPEGTSLRFLVNAGNVLREDWLTFTQQALEEIGITVEPEAIEYATLVERVTASRDYDACGVDFTGVTAEPSELFDQFHSTSPGNYMGYNNPDLDALLEQARTELDMDAAKEIYVQIQAIIMDEVPTFFAWYRPFLHVLRAGYEGYTDSGAYGLFHTLEDWTYTGE